MPALSKLAAYFVLGIVLGLGMRVSEYLIEKPPSKLLICIADGTGVIGDCSPFEDYVADLDSSPVHDF